MRWKWFKKRWKLRWILKLFGLRWILGWILLMGGNGVEMVSTLALSAAIPPFFIAVKPCLAMVITLQKLLNKMLLEVSRWIRHIADLSK